MMKILAGICSDSSSSWKMNFTLDSSSKDWSLGGWNLEGWSLEGWSLEGCFYYDSPKDHPSKDYFLEADDLTMGYYSKG